MFFRLTDHFSGRIWDGKEAVIEALTEGVIFAAASLPSGVTPDAAVLGSALDKDNSNEAKYGGSDGKSQSNVRSHQSSYLEVVKIILVFQQYLNDITLVL